MALIEAPAKPCGSCPYRRDVPWGIWHPEEYEKLSAYDGPTWGQSPALFMCHQRDGKLCAGWLACHNPKELLALRIPRDIDPAVFDYSTSVPVFESGAAARDHGIAEIRRLSPRARKLIDGLIKKRKSA